MEKLSEEQKRKDETYLDSMETYQYELWDLFRTDQLSPTEYRRLLDESDKNYREFYAELTKE